MLLWVLNKLIASEKTLSDEDLSGKSDAQSLNQISRWVTTKESHAQNAQETILNYWESFIS